MFLQSSVSCSLIELSAFFIIKTEVMNDVKAMNVIKDNRRSFFTFSLFLAFKTNSSIFFIVSILSQIS